MKKTVLLAITLVFSLCLPASSAHAAGNIPLGLRTGFSSGPDQFHLGGHALLGELFPGIDLTPNIEVGFGSGFTTFALNADFTYRFTEMVGAPWGTYAGGELGLVYLDHDFGSTTDLGFSLLGGVTKLLDNGHTVLGEIKLGVLDSPDFKITAGYTFF